MGEEKLLTVREVSLILGITEKEVMDLAESGQVPAYKVGGVFLRFKREQIMQLKKKFPSAYDVDSDSTLYPLRDKINDFFYFNDFYILAILLIILLLGIIILGK
jgi:excisionase family DNA binding protein